MKPRMPPQVLHSSNFEQARHEVTRCTSDYHALELGLRDGYGAPAFSSSLQVLR